MSYKDPIKQREYQKNHFQNNKQKYRDSKNASRQRRRDFVNEIKKQPCSDCGKNYPYYIMDLDHKPENQKLFDVSRLISNGTWTILKQEVLKCDVVCSNCHRERSYKRQFNATEKNTI